MDNPKSHSLACTCETCLQNHPERDYLDDYPDYDNDPFNDEPDEWEPGMDCGIFRDGGRYYCGAAGSEQCDECPNSSQIGRKRWYTPKSKAIT